MMMQRNEDRSKLISDHQKSKPFQQSSDNKKCNESVKRKKKRRRNERKNKNSETYSSKKRRDQRQHSKRRRNQDTPRVREDNYNGEYTERVSGTRRSRRLQGEVSDDEEYPSEIVDSSDEYIDASSSDSCTESSGEEEVRGRGYQEYIPPDQDSESEKSYRTKSRRKRTASSPQNSKKKMKQQNKIGVKGDDDEVIEVPIPKKHVEEIDLTLSEALPIQTPDCSIPVKQEKFGFKREVCVQTDSFDTEISHLKVSVNSLETDSARFLRYLDLQKAFYYYHQTRIPSQRSLQFIDHFFTTKECQEFIDFCYLVNQDYMNQVTIPFDKHRFESEFLTAHITTPKQSSIHNEDPTSIRFKMNDKNAVVPSFIQEFCRILVRYIHPETTVIRFRLQLHENGCQQQVLFVEDYDLLQHSSLSTSHQFSFFMVISLLPSQNAETETRVLTTDPENPSILKSHSIGVGSIALFPGDLPHAFPSYINDHLSLWIGLGTACYNNFTRKCMNNSGM